MNFDSVARNNVFSYAAATQRGVSQREMRAALKSSQVAQLHRGWYTTTPTTDPKQLHLLRLEALLQQYGSDVAASHWSHVARAELPTYAANWQLVCLRRRKPGGSQKCGPGFVVHPAFHGADTADPDALAGTALALSIVLSGLADPLGLLVPADAALAKKVVTPSELGRAVDLLEGRRGVARVRAALPLAQPRHQSAAETRTNWVCTGLGYVLEPQFHVPGTEHFTPGGRGYFTDFRVTGTWVLVEFDGHVKYTVRPGETVEQARNRVLWAEKQREDRIRALGWEIVRLTWADLGRPERVRAQIEAALARAAARPGSGRAG